MKNELEAPGIESMTSWMFFQIEMSEAEKQKIVVQISSVQTELQRTIDERLENKSLQNSIITGFSVFISIW